jgi:hypothetical protein
MKSTLTIDIHDSFVPLFDISFGMQVSLLVGANECQ